MRVKKTDHVVKRHNLGMDHHIATCRAELVAVLTTLQNGVPEVLTLQDGQCLPAGPLETEHTSLQRGLRHWVEQQTGFRLGHVEQLYTFGDAALAHEDRLVRISYMALTRDGQTQGGWQSWYNYFPWEDRRTNGCLTVLKTIEDRLKGWAGDQTDRLERCNQVFGLNGESWNDDAVLERYELLWEAGLVQEAASDAQPRISGQPMLWDHRRILATALSRLRAKIRYTPAVFELVPEEFTLLHLQQAMEALSGRLMHKQNFRRLVQNQQLVEETDRYESGVHGRPARLYRFRRENSENCYLSGAKLPLGGIS
ncbi:hypothetical protein Gbth_047_023 [Gluconobacter thailandicus F149-1 = NBRC 100600]|nr:hypothetical protein Gbth_047_023 [Gluconobacter thailandicus F149-1 = NBRC 100600]GBR57219.1 hypothetical protein AA100600_0141 [Gluconobacter thailandicus F149-1 = NBRC 100600]GEL87876.1 membrane protein [Gluconobacter thailandicus F149-1 = NBRC 100600]